jgi:hypothetical protein
MKLYPLDIEIAKNSLNEKGVTSPTNNQIALEFVRQYRMQLLAQSDWMAVSDRTMTQAQIDYRQALRDLPQIADPQLDEQGNLTNVTWPTYE